MVEGPWLKFDVVVIFPLKYYSIKDSSKHGNVCVTQHQPKQYISIFSCQKTNIKHLARLTQLVFEGHRKKNQMFPMPQWEARHLFKHVHLRTIPQTQRTKVIYNLFTKEGQISKH